MLDADWLLTSLRTPLLSSLCVILQGVSHITGIMVPSSFPLLIPLSLSFPSHLVCKSQKSTEEGKPLALLTDSGKVKANTFILIHEDTCDFLFI